MLCTKMTNLHSILREFVKTHVILTPGALLVGWEPHFVLQLPGDPADPRDPGRCSKIVF